MTGTRFKHILDGEPRTIEEDIEFFEECERERQEYLKQMEAQNNKPSAKDALKDNKQ